MVLRGAGNGFVLCFFFVCARFATRRLAASRAARMRPGAGGGKRIERGSLAFHARLTIGASLRKTGIGHSALLGTGAREGRHNGSKGKGKGDAFHGALVGIAGLQKTMAAPRLARTAWSSYERTPPHFPSDGGLCASSHSRHMRQGADGRHDPGRFSRREVIKKSEGRPGGVIFKTRQAAGLESEFFRSFNETRKRASCLTVIRPEGHGASGRKLIGTCDRDARKTSGPEWIAKVGLDYDTVSKPNTRDYL